MPNFRAAASNAAPDLRAGDDDRGFPVSLHPDPVADHLFVQRVASGDGVGRLLDQMVCSAVPERADTQRRLAVVQDRGDECDGCHDPRHARGARTRALWALPGPTLQELADLLATPSIIRAFTVMRALNLDGGPSTGLWWKDTSSAEHYDKEKWHVKNMLVIIPKK